MQKIQKDLTVELSADRPGIAATAFRQLGEAGVNVTFAYVANGNRLVVGAADIKKAAEVVARLGAPTA